MPSVVYDLTSSTAFPFDFSWRHDSNGDMNSDTTWRAALFTADRTESMTGFDVHLGSNTGTVTNAFKADLYAVDANSHPTGASLATVTTTPVAGAPTAITWSTPYTVTNGTTYAIVIRNLNSVGGNGLSAGSNFFRLLGASKYIDNHPLTSTDSGAHWGLATSGIGIALWVRYQTSGTKGVIAGVGGVGGGGGIQLYNTSGSRVARYAVRVRFPYAVKLWQISTHPGALKSGTANYNLKAEVCSASAVLSTCTTRPYADQSTNGVDFRWDTPYELAANTDYYICVTPDGASAGDGSNHVRVLTANIFKPSVIVGPIKGSYSSTGTTVSWTEDTTKIPLFTMHFSAAGGGGTVAYGHP